MNTVVVEPTGVTPDDVLAVARAGARVALAPAARSARASGYRDRVENSAPGSRVATVDDPASASMSTVDIWVQWSAEAAPSSTASCTPGPGPSWFACTRAPRPAASPAFRTVRARSPSNAPCSQNTSIQRAYGRAAASMSPHTSET